MFSKCSLMTEECMWRNNTDLANRFCYYRPTSSTTTLQYSHGLYYRPNLSMYMLMNHDCVLNIGLMVAACPTTFSKQYHFQIAPLIVIYTLIVKFLKILYTLIQIMCNCQLMLTISYFKVNYNYPQSTYKWLIHSEINKWKYLT